MLIKDTKIGISWNILKSELGRNNNSFDTHGKVVMVSGPRIF
jgi:hypothetical protein